jgi:hypothetical protein
MNGATAEPWVKIISPPNSAKTSNIGNNQYFFRTFKKFQNSIIKSILELIFHIII